MKIIQRFIALLSALTVAASLVAVPVHADGGLVPAGDGWITPGSGGAGAVTPAGAVAISTDMASMLLNEVEEVGQGIRDDISAGARWLYSKINEDYCTEAENHRHSFKKQHTMVDGTVNNFYVCEHCGKSGGEVLGAAYGDTVDGMPVNGVDSNSGFLWYPTINDLYVDDSHEIKYAGDYGVVANSIPFVTEDINNNTKWELSGNDRTLTAVRIADNTVNNRISRTFGFTFWFNIRVMGVYTVLPNTGYHSLTVGFPNGNVTPIVGFDSSMDYEINSLGPYLYHAHSAKKDYVLTVNAEYTLPVFRVVPSASVDRSLYVSDTRPAAYVNQYLVQSGDTYTDSSTSIVNEDNSTIYNPHRCLW